MIYPNGLPDFWFKPIPCSNQLIIVDELTVFLEAEIPRLSSAISGFGYIDIPSFILATPTLQAWLRELNCPPLRFVASFVLPAMTDQKIHTDNQKNNLALNFGLQVKDTSTAMYKIILGSPFEQPYGRQGYTFFDYSRCKFEKVTEFTLESDPILLNVHQLHNVINQTPNTRVAISLRFVQDPVHLI
jgi:hypothetical protein